MVSLKFPVSSMDISRPFKVTNVPFFAFPFISITPSATVTPSLIFTFLIFTPKIKSFERKKAKTIIIKKNRERLPTLTIFFTLVFIILRYLCFHYAQFFLILLSAWRRLPDLLLRVLPMYPSGGPRAHILILTFFANMKLRLYPLPQRRLSLLRTFHHRLDYFHLPKCFQKYSYPPK